MPSIMWKPQKLDPRLQKGPDFKQSSPLGFEISCSAISTGMQECLSAQSEPIGIMLILRE